MGVTEILQIDAADTMLQLNGLQDIGLPLLGIDYGAAESVVDSFNNRAEAVVLSTIPEIYRQMTREVRGEIVVEMAYPGQSVFVLGLTPVITDSVALYVDYGKPGYAGGGLPSVNVVSTSGTSYGSHGDTPYTFRSIFDRLPADRYTVNTDSGEVTLIGYPLSAGQKVYADYQHKGMARCHNLRDIAIRLAAANFGNSLAGITDSARDFLMQLQETAMNQLYALLRGEGGIDLLDQLKLVDETRQPYRIPRRGYSVWM